MYIAHACAPPRRRGSVRNTDCESDSDIAGQAEVKFVAHKACFMMATLYIRK